MIKKLTKKIKTLNFIDNGSFAENEIKHRY